MFHKNIEDASWCENINGFISEVSFRYFPTGHFIMLPFHMYKVKGKVVGDDEGAFVELKVGQTNVFSLLQLIVVLSIVLFTFINNISYSSLIKVALFIIGVGFSQYLISLVCIDFLKRKVVKCLQLSSSSLP
ncbi:hypothetical protein RCC89_20565 [Cytophagaceae bacterium ABcell3]|nr:hypothetical protein RCC89_20565 [Cytophagaceae bacterium ABcell3]